jgi:hypothetical protein
MSKQQIAEALAKHNVRTACTLVDLAVLVMESSTSKRAESRFPLVRLHSRLRNAKRRRSGAIGQDSAGA